MIHRTAQAWAEARSPSAPGAVRTPVRARLAVVALVTLQLGLPVLADQDEAEQTAAAEAIQRLLELRDLDASDMPNCDLLPGHSTLGADLAAFLAMLNGTGNSIDAGCQSDGGAHWCEVTLRQDQGAVVWRRTYRFGLSGGAEPRPDQSTLECFTIP